MKWWAPPFYLPPTAPALSPVIALPSTEAIWPPASTPEPANPAHSEPDSGIQRNLPRVEGRVVDGSERGTGRHSGKQPGGCIGRQVCCAQSIAVVAVQFSVVQQICRVRGNLKADPFAYPEVAAQAQIHVEPARPAEIAVAISSIADPVQVGND